MGKSNSLEDYMKSILILSKRNGSVRSIDIAEELGVSKPSVSNAMKRLREANSFSSFSDSFLYSPSIRSTI